MLGELKIRLRGLDYRLGYKYWSTGEVDLKYGYVKGRPMPAPTLKMMEIKWQPLLVRRISKQIMEG